MRHADEIAGVSLENSLWCVLSVAKAATGNEQLDSSLDSDELFLCCFIVVDLCSEPCLSQMPNIDHP